MGTSEIMWSKCGLFLVIFTVFIGKNLSASQDKRALAIFNVVKFKNDPCVSTSTTMNNGNRNGTCYTSEECSKNNGRAEGNCASGFGVCCVFTIDTCGETVSQNCSYIRNEGFPTALSTITTADCEFKVEKCNPDVCTLRLDFEDFAIDSWAATSTLDSVFKCRDKLAITTSPAVGAAPPEICGSNAGQHIYIEMGTSATAASTLKFTFDTTVTTDRTFEIKVTQIECNNAARPPEGCLQYFVGTEGRVKSFNWDAGTGHLQNQAYTMCIRQEKGFCCAKYSLCPSEANFELNVNNDDLTMALAQTGSACTEDFIIIEGSSSTCTLNPNTNRYCGSHLNDDNMAKASVSICDCTSPFEIRVITDGEFDADGTTPNNDPGVMSVSKGLCLDYVQEPCTTTLVP